MKRTYYCVTTCFYDNGRVTASIIDVVEATTKPENTSHEGKRCDIYNDWFSTKKEALEFINEARNA